MREPAKRRKPTTERRVMVARQNPRRGSKTDDHALEAGGTNHVLKRILHFCQGEHQQKRLLIAMFYAASSRYKRRYSYTVTREIPFRRASSATVVFRSFAMSRFQANDPGSSNVF